MSVNDEKGNLKLYILKGSYLKMFTQAYDCDLIIQERVMPTRIFVNSQQHDTEITLCREEINFNSDPSFKSFKPWQAHSFPIKK